MTKQEVRNSNVSTPAAGAAETEYSDVTGDVQLLSPEDSDEEETEVTRSSSVAETNQDEAGSYVLNFTTSFYIHVHANVLQ